MAAYAGSDHFNGRDGWHARCGDDAAYGGDAFEGFEQRCAVTRSRLERWSLQSAAAMSLGFAEHGPLADRLGQLPERLGKCCRVSFADHVGVDHSLKTGAASYSNLTTCGSVWVCKVCSAKVSEKRRQELTAGVGRWTDKGGRVLLLSLTFPHHLSDALPDLYARFAKALKLFWGGRAAQGDALAWGLAGIVTASEITWGAKNGWHPHAHILLFLDADSTVTVHAVRARLMDRWRKVCIKAGLLDADDLDELAAFAEYGLDVRGGDKAAGYVAKFGQDDAKQTWDLACEVTKAHLKSGKGKNVTPWDLLRLYADDGDVEAADLFNEYAAATKGKRQLRLSPGLRELLELGKEKTDEELAQERGEDVLSLARIPLPLWRLVVRQDVRGTLLMVAGSGQAGDVWDFLERLQRHRAPQMTFIRPDACLESVTESG